MKNTKRECEVLVVGGGSSGIAAAVSASGRGADTLLIEKNSFPGGSAVAGLHRFICGLYINSKQKPKDTLNAGIVREVSSRLQALAPEITITRIGKVYVLPFLTKDLKAVFHSLIYRRSHLKVLYNSRGFLVKTDKNRIKVVSVRSPKGTIDIIPKVVLDCSGEGVIIRLSGAGYRLTPLKQRQLSSYSFRVKGLSKSDDMISIKVPYYLKQAIREKKLPAYLKFTTFFPGDDVNEGIFKLSITPTKGINSVDCAKSDARETHRYLISALSSFRSSRITEMSSEVLKREGVRVRGEYSLSADDVIKARKFPDGVVKNAWPIELWNQKKGPQYQYLKPGDYYQIPLRCLKAKDIVNLYCAGRCISVSHEALGSTRVMGTCMALGEQAGFAAARYCLEKANL